jgi:crotonobetainyl-CoA:carnitine CoA-transferase CaiB-like acyl-CoA transferase
MFLDDIFVVDLCIYGQGPLTSAILSDLGARIVKVEDLAAGGDPMRRLELLYGVPQQIEVNGRKSEVGYEYYSRGKDSIALDYSTDAAQGVLDRLFAKADVVVHNARRRRVAQAGIGYDRVRALNPKVIYLESSAFGSEGPRGDDPGFDGQLLGYSGAMFAPVRSTQGPDPLIGAFGDYVGGAAGVASILAALHRRAVTGLGAHLETSQLGAMIALQGLHFANVALTGREYERLARDQEPNPLYNYYRCKDGTWAIIAGIDLLKDWAKVCEAIGLPHLADDPRAKSFDAMVGHAPELVREFDRAIAKMDRDDVLAALRAANVFCGPVHTIEEAYESEQVRLNGYLADVPGEDFPLSVWPVKLDGEPAQVAKRAPTMGEHTDEILHEFGYTSSEITQMRAAGAVG